ncbi:hypothetical protein CTAYLR_005253 [Chrysophaeum taylorii]|uniref:Uncharacterized protein n=1 Tax=Chrysophaeum taylorii TaxID=2483200 RepID=A0AAD7XPI0_9STRA|nr:hypothetical protein CTAYLR_005253 [Chrysophaeum taylorii]
MRRPKTFFMADAKYDDVIRALRERGWRSSDNSKDDASLVWQNLATTDFEALRPHQLVNHMRGIQVLSHKATLARLAFDAPAYPRCYDLRSRAHAGALVGHYARVVAAAVVVAAAAAEGREDGREDGRDGEDAAAACVDLLNETATTTTLPSATLLARLFGVSGGLETWTVDAARRRCRWTPELVARGRRALEGAAWAHGVVEGSFRNIWIVKPAGGSCGDGIACVSSLSELVEIARAARWRVVAQRYVERPFLVRKKKFDIRQWVLITSASPLIVWGLDRCYARFAAKDWNLENLEDRFAHLCNYSVQREFSGPSPVVVEDAFPPFQGNMWHSADLAAYVGADDWEAVVEPQIRSLSVSVAKLAATTGLAKVANGFEWLGLDIILAEDLSAWLLEVNVSPDVSRSTPVTADLVPAATEDALRLLLDERHAEDGRRTSRNPPIAPDRRRQRPGGGRSAARWVLWFDDDEATIQSSGDQAQDRTPNFRRRYKYVADPPDALDTWWADLMASTRREADAQDDDDDDDDDDDTEL